MNERIKRLLNEATSGHEQEHDRSKVMTVSDKEMAKFAQLIVAECAKVAYKYAADSKNYAYYDDVGWDCLPNDLKNHIEQHFGVEE